MRANNLPDIALFPQPGILKDFVKQGKMTDLSTQLDVNKLQADWSPACWTPARWTASSTASRSR